MKTLFYTSHLKCIDLTCTEFDNYQSPNRIDVLDFPSRTFAPFALNDLDN